MPRGLLSWFKVGRRPPTVQTPTSVGAEGSDPGLADPEGRGSWGAGLLRRREEGGGDLTSSVSNEGMTWGLWVGKKRELGAGALGWRRGSEAPTRTR